MKKTYAIEILSIYGQEFSKAEQELIAEAQCVFGGKALLTQLFPFWNCEKKSDNKTIFHAIESPLEKIYELIKNYHEQGKRVLVLADGDALYFGIGASLLRHIGAEKLNIRSGISIVQKLCAAVALPWQDVRHMSLHGRTSQQDWQKLSVAVFSNKPVCLLVDEQSSPYKVANFLISRGLKDLIMYVGENLGLQSEKLYKLSLTKAAKHTKIIQGFCTLLLVPSKSCARPFLGLDATKIAREKNLMTKASVRAAALSLLQITPEHTLWDIGSGSGAVALEMCALAHKGHVIAVEKNIKRIEHIEKNRKLMGACILEIVHAEAFESIQHLPRPHGVFVGGGLSANNSESLLEGIYAALPQGGRMVISCVLLGSLHKAELFFKTRNIPWNALQINVNNSEVLGKDIRLVPENPVFLLCAEKA